MTMINTRFAELPRLYKNRTCELKPKPTKTRNPYAANNSNGWKYKYFCSPRLSKVIKTLHYHTVLQGRHQLNEC